MQHTPGPSEPALRFADEARRVRSRSNGSPRQMHAALQTLTVRPPAMRIMPEPIPESDHNRLKFAREVIDRLDGPILRYSMRLELYKLARRWGISVFDANLIIAQVQHQAGAVDADATRDSRRGAPAWMLPAALALLTQAAILGAGWAIFC